MRSSNKRGPQRPRIKIPKSSAGTSNATATQTEDRDALGKGSPDDMRKRLLDDIKKDLDDDVCDKVLKERYRNKLKDCIWDRNGTHPTVLHWIMARVRLDFGNENNAEDSKLIKAAEVLIALAMECDENLVGESDKGGETALHQSIESHKARVRNLSLCMCLAGEDEGSRKRNVAEAVAKAIARPNRRGENCLHLAIEKDAEIAMKLIPLASSDAFQQKRIAKNEDQEVPRGGNTPLHDAVDYARCRLLRPSCVNDITGGQQCHQCQEAEEKYHYGLYLSTELTRRLIDRHDNALKIKNANDESPYLYHLRTKKAFHHVFNDKIEGSNAGNSRSELPMPMSPPTKGSSSRVASLNCATKEDDTAATYVEEYLTESAFAIGGFEDACACFFGDNPDEDGKSAPLRPGYHVTSTSYKTYEQLIPEGTSVLSQVDLSIGPIAVANSNPPRSSALSSEGSPTTHQIPRRYPGDDPEQEILDHWQRNMKWLTKVFDMLYKRGVRRILKVTVRDNDQRPCSDRVIQSCLEPFDVRYLDWNKADLCIDVVYSACRKVAELTLYSSGRQAVLRSWTSNDGLCELTQLRGLKIVAEKGLETHGDFLQNIKTFETTLRENIMLSRWRLFLTSERDSLKEPINEIKEALVQIADKSEDHDEQNQGLDATAAGGHKDQLKEDLHWQKEEARAIDAQLSRVENKRETLRRQRRKCLTAAVETDKSDDTEPTDNDDPEDSVYESQKTDDELSISVFSQSDSGFSVFTSTDGPSRLQQPWLQCREDDFLEPPAGSSKLFTVWDDDDDCIYVAWDFKIEDKQLQEDRSGQDVGGKGGIKRRLTDKQLNAVMETNQWFQAVRGFVERRVQIEEPSAKAWIKVALIDDGVDVSQFESRAVKYPGWPPAGPTSKDQLWCYSEGGHGTSMAKLIHKMCPWVKLFVAKLGGKDHITNVDRATNAAQAVKWAIDQGVNIISMSWSLVKTSDNASGIRELEQQIQRAASAKIIMYCAAADKGPYEDNAKLYPSGSDTKSIRVVGSAKENGGESHFVDPGQVDYLFPGEGIKELNGRDGSSAATALASGFAALLLWCFQQRPPKAAPNLIAGAERMHDVFESLKRKNGNSKWVNVTPMLLKDGSATIEDVVNHCSSAARLQTGTRNR